MKVLALDFDGVIVDSLPVRDEGFRKVFSKYGEELASKAEQYHKNHRGMFRREKFTQIFEKILKLSPSEEQLDEIENHFARSIEEEILNSPLLPGISFIELLPDDISKYIVSAAPQNEVRIIAKHKGINHIFKNIFGGPKSKVKILNEILEMEGCTADSLVFIGDAYNDYKVSVEVGCEFLGVVLSKNSSPFPDQVKTYENMSECIRKIYPNHIKQLT